MCTKEAEYGRDIHSNAPNYVPLRGNGADYRDVGCEKVVGSGGTGTGRIVGSNVGIITGGEGRKDGWRSVLSSGILNHGTN